VCMHLEQEESNITDLGFMYSPNISSGAMENAIALRFKHILISKLFMLLHPTLVDHILHTYMSTNVLPIVSCYLCWSLQFKHELSGSKRKVTIVEASLQKLHLVEPLESIMGPTLLCISSDQGIPWDNILHWKLLKHFVSYAKQATLSCCR
jgi:hypothetical protein